MEFNCNSDADMDYTTEKLFVILKKIVHVQVRLSESNIIQFPDHIIMLLAKFSESRMGIFSTEFKSQNIIKLEKNSTIAHSTSDFHCYVISNEQPVKSGIHCWRIFFNTQCHHYWVYLYFLKIFELKLLNFSMQLERSWMVFVINFHFHV